MILDDGINADASFLVFGVLMRKRKKASSHFRFTSKSAGEYD